jgi:hypothetical protein
MPREACRANGPKLDAYAQKSVILRAFRAGNSPMSKRKSSEVLSFQDLILKLQQYWAERG